MVDEHNTDEDTDKTDESSSNAYSELDEIHADESVDTKDERGRPTKEEIAKKDPVELRAKYGPFVDLEIDRDE